MAKIHKTTTKSGEDRYHMRVVVGYQPNGTAIQRMLTAASRRELEAAARALQVDLARGNTADPGKIRLAQFIQEWQKRQGRRVRPTTMAFYDEVIARYIMPALGGRLLRELNTRMLQQWIDGLGTPGIAYRGKAVLHNVLADVVRQGLLQSNPASHLSLPAKPPAQTASWSIQEARAFLQVARDHAYHPYWYLAVRLALRPSELLGLRWASVDLDAGTLVVRDTRPDVGSKQFDGNGRTKSPSGARTLDLPADVLAVLKGHKVVQARRRLKAGPAWQDSNLVCAGEDGNFIENTNINRALVRLCKLSGVPRIRPYDLRHTAISLMAEAGADFKAISEVAGHADVRTTRNVYQHTSRRQRAAALESLGEALEEGKEDGRAV